MGRFEVGEPAGLSVVPISPDVAGQDGDRALSRAEQHQREKAARRHGLYARSRGARKQRHYRAGRLLSRLQDLIDLVEMQIPTARAWCEHEVLAADAYAALMHDQAEGVDNEKLLDSYLRIRSRQLAYAKELGLTPAASVSLAGSASTADIARAAQERIRAKVAQQVIPAPAAGAEVLPS